jgi:hypothetical protein
MGVLSLPQQLLVFYEGLFSMELVKETMVPVYQMFSVRFCVLGQ